MARTPRSHIPKTSGQGVSRLSYQKSYDIARRGDAPKISGSGRTKSEKPGLIKGSGGGRTGYDRKGDKTISGINLSAYLPADIEAIENFGKGVSNKPSARLEPGDPKKLKK